MLLAPVLFAGVFSGWIAIAQFYLRHAGLTALTFVAPLPVAAVGYWLGLQFEIELAPVCAMYACLFVIICVLLAFGRIARGVCDGLSPHDAVITALIGVVTPIGTTVAAFAFSVLAVVAFSPMLKTGLAAIVLILVAFALTLFAGWLAQWLSYSEKFIADANAARERRERLGEMLSRTVETRWALSISGMTIILATVAAFGVQALRVQAWGFGIGIRVAVVALVTFVLLVLAARNWRLALAQFLTLVFEVVLGLWAFARDLLPMIGDDAMLMELSVTISATSLALLASAASRQLREGYLVETALSRALQQDGPGVALACIAATVPWLIVTLSGGAASFQLVAAFASIPGTLLVFPAVARAIYTLFPRYRSVEDVFGRR
jgi:hypothetical protein